MNKSPLITIFSLLLLLPNALAKVKYPGPDGTKGPGQLPITVASLEYLGDQITLSGPIYRDAAFSGVLDGKIIWTYSDTMWITNGTIRDFVSDTWALGDIKNLTTVDDVGVNSTNKPKNFLPLTKEEISQGGLFRWGMWLSNIVEIAPNQGLLYYDLLDRPNAHIDNVYSGVATVTIDSTGIPKATRNSAFLWSTNEPQWGSNGATYNPKDGYVYAYSGGLNCTYLARVQAPQATDVDAYEYWDNSTQTWGTQRVGDGTNGTKKLDCSMAVWGLQAHGQSNPFWSTYYNTWMTVYGTMSAWSDVYAMTADNLWGPWSEPVFVASSCPDNKCDGKMRYVMAPHPEYDPTGKTLFVSWSDNNLQSLLKIHWDGPDA